MVFQAASNGKYVDSCLTMLVTNFTPPRTKDDKSYSIGKKNQVIPRVHAALKNITDLVPLAPLRLSPIILQGMPTVHSKHDSVSLI